MLYDFLKAARAIALGTALIAALFDNGPALLFFAYLAGAFWMLSLTWENQQLRQELRRVRRTEQR